MRKDLFRAVCLVALVLVLGILVDTGHTKEKAPYLLGIIDALTGHYAPLGVDAKKAQDLAIEEINAAGGVNGRPIKGIYYDDESQPPKAADLVRKLKDKNVIAIIGGQGFPLAMASGKAANEERVPFFAKTPAPNPLEKGHPGSYVFGTVIYDFDFLIGSCIKFLAKGGGPKIAALFTSDPMGEFYNKMLKGIKKKNPGLFEVVGTEWMLTTDVDITPQLTKLKALKPDGIFVGPSGRPATVVYKNLDLMDWDILAVTTSANSQTAFINSVRGFSDRVRIGMPAAGLRPDTIPDDDPGDVPALRKLAKKFMEKTGKIIFDGAAPAYDVIYCIAEVIDKLDLDPEKHGVQEMRDKIRQALETQSYQGALVSVQRTPEDHRGAARYRIYQAKIEGEWFVPVKYIEYPSMEWGQVGE